MSFWTRLSSLVRWQHQSAYIALTVPEFVITGWALEIRVATKMLLSHKYHCLGANPYYSSELSLYAPIFVHARSITSSSCLCFQCYSSKRIFGIRIILRYYLFNACIKCQCCCQRGGGIWMSAILAVGDSGILKEMLWIAMQI